MKKILQFIPRRPIRLARRMAAAVWAEGPHPWPPPRQPDPIRLAALRGARRLRFGVIGLGTMGRTHAQVLRRRGPLVCLAAVTSRDRDKRTAAQELDCKWFDSPREMIASGDVDAVVVATPHPAHAAIAIEALAANLHVVCEKPLASTVSEADAVVRAAAQSRGLLTVVSQTRFEPAYQFARSMIESGHLGPLLSCQMQETFWRASSYFKAGAWRGTWRGEGGGVLINQAIHLLDRYVWLCGMPEWVSGMCDTVMHPIEVEDTASAVLRHSGGAHGLIHVSTTECPSTSRTVISCDRGLIVIEGGGGGGAGTPGRMRVTRLMNSSRHRAAADLPGARDIESEVTEYAGQWFGWSNELLGRFYDQFALAATGHGDLPARPAEAVGALELANAIALSSAQGRSLRLPLDRAAYDAFLAARIGGAGVACSESGNGTPGMNPSVAQPLES